MKADCSESRAMVSTPVGWVEICEEYGLISSVTIESEGANELPQTALLCLAVQQIEEYFSGHRQDFTLPLKDQGTAFRQKCWDALCRIPYGQTRSYGEQARMIGGTRYARAVGQANHHNPYSIIVPCHRVVASDGTLGGYASGLNRKQWLLDHERSNMAKGSS